MGAEPVSFIDLEIFTENFRKHYCILPNALHRGEGPWTGFTLRERALLAALLSMDSGWTTSRKNINDLAPELGHKAVSTVLQGLRTKRVLYTKQCHASDGMFRWRWLVYTTPRDESFDPFAVVDGGVVDGEPAGVDAPPELSTGTGPGTIDPSTIVPSRHDGRDQGK